LLYKAREREILERLGRSLGNEDLDVKALIEELESLSKLFSIGLK
jgi:glycyl-tRNA synthetase